MRVSSTPGGASSHSPAKGTPARDATAAIAARSAGAANTASTMTGPPAKSAAAAAAHSAS